MKTKHLRAYEETIKDIMKIALNNSAERGEIVTVADTLKEIIDDYKSRQKNRKRLNKVSIRNENDS